jgi:hypothetical protein
MQIKFLWHHNKRPNMMKSKHSTNSSDSANNMSGNDKETRETGLSANFLDEEKPAQMRVWDDDVALPLKSAVAAEEATSSPSPSRWTRKRHIETDIENADMGNPRSKIHTYVGPSSSLGPFSSLDAETTDDEIFSFASECEYRADLSGKMWMAKAMEGSAPAKRPYLFSHSESRSSSSLTEARKILKANSHSIEDLPYDKNPQYWVLLRMSPYNMTNDQLSALIQFICGAQ